MMGSGRISHGNGRKNQMKLVPPFFLFLLLILGKVALIPNIGAMAAGYR